MQHIPATLEEQLLLKAIKEECSWESLPKRLQATLSSKEDWHRRIIDHCIKKRLQWNTSFVRKVCKESEYYDDMMRYLRRNLALFPYHLAEYVCRVMRISPFRYYCDMIFEVMKNENPYDSIPNFSAADALRLTGIGRNEFIDIMNKCRSKKIMWKLNKSIARELLPSQPIDFVVDPWWGVCLVNFTLEEFKKLSEEEMATIDKVCKEEANSFILFDPDIVKGLYRRGLIYFDVPVYPDDRFKVSRLEGFVSNREQSYEDPIEELLYAVFVVSSENATVAELAATLQADLLQLQAAASFACRLGWAVKVIDPASVLQDTSIPNSPRTVFGDEDGSLAASGSSNMLSDGDGSQQGYSGTDSLGPDCAHRVAFVVDANITSYLMMGSVSPGLKSHAVTLYEAGKLGHACIADLCKDLTTLEGAKFEGGLQEFANHAFSLRCVLECLLVGGVAINAKGEEGIFDKLDAQASDNNESSSLVTDTSSGEKLEYSTTDDQKCSAVLLKGSASSESLKNSVGDDMNSANCLNGRTSFSQASDPVPHLQIDNKSTQIDELDIGESLKRIKKYQVDILRCESLASLAPSTLNRLFLRDYDVVVSMIPLPPSSILPGPTGPIHFGPPSYSSITPWMKLVLYSTVASGPLSVILMKGQCLRMLPAPLAGCEKALIWSWGGSNIGGLGGKFEGNFVKGSVLLHCLNALLKYAAVLVQPLSKYDIDKNGKAITVDVPLPLKNSDGSITQVGNDLDLSKEEISGVNSLLIVVAKKIELWAVGYIRLLKLFKERESENFSSDDTNYEWVPLSVEFGIPLFSPKLCDNICRRVVSSELLQSDLRHKHHEAMQGLRKRLRDVCSEYQATGPAARLLYQKEQPKELSKQLLNYASGRWNPLVDPSSPISGAANEHQRLKLANRHRCCTEVLSFDGTILRSYALAPGYEAATRPIEEALPNSKGESDETDSKEVVLPGVNMIFDGTELHPFDIGACQQARQPIALVAEAAAASAAATK
ncbi:protein FAM91A1-like [Cucurbita moschata]|uniref:Protein FAM91A1-like n=1 Tax=Cucurbita moschata TaxID=3662 RepID=A0A6J1FJR8_CUCMO|nr:protein FAM91A1-like [Cucurbita moschata]XP_022940491.1 protein FAM91A1-like [Cucurbita moschata]XP_022940492.1 protein FAM91A1-like [Cucurbita moschata]XP_022940493.1 protein FAM91A1-like [Cucurbita moschata]XP_022940494.1 protein FAM91A1-like [Cucurbita moschata]